MKLNSYIDHTLLKATAQSKDIKQLCEEAINYNFYAVCVNGCFVTLAKSYLQNSEIKLAAVIGFPLGAMSTNAKVFEAKSCIEGGADEIDMVINIGKLQEGDFNYIEEEINAIKQVMGDKKLKVILETCYLSEVEKRITCQLAKKAGADFVKTSTGFGTYGATLEDIRIMKEEIGEKMEIKASGGIKNRETAMLYIEEGVNRIGTSSGLAIVSE